MLAQKTKRVAVVTGANRGLGLGTAEELARRGYAVYMLARDPAKMQKHVAHLQTEGHDVRPFALDVTHPEQAEKLATQIADAFGHLDVLVNNAGVFLEPESGSAQVGEASVFKSSPQTVLETFQINTLGPLLMIQALAPLIRKSAQGRIVNVSSGMGALSDMNASWPGYRLSKTALNALTRITASEFRGTSVKVNSVCPGWVKTDMGGAGAQRTIPEGVAGIVWAATLPSDGPTGGFFRDGKRIDW